MSVSSLSASSAGSLSFRSMPLSSAVSSALSSACFLVSWRGFCAPLAPSFGGAGLGVPWPPLGLGGSLGDDVLPPAAPFALSAAPLAGFLGVFDADCATSLGQSAVLDD